MSLSHGQYSNQNLARPLRRRTSPDAPGRARPIDRAVAVAERQTLTGALERVADRRPGVAVPEVLYVDLAADVPSAMRTLLLAQMAADNLAAATDTCSAVVRLMALQPTRRWLDPRLVLRVALLVHEKGGQDLPLLTAARELVAAQSRWQASANRRGIATEAADSQDWVLVRELTALPLNFAPKLRSIIARSIIRDDLLGARDTLRTYAKRHPDAAVESRRLFDKHAPSLSSLFGAELTPTRPMVRARLPQPPRVESGPAHIAWYAAAALVVAATAMLLVARPSVAKEQHAAVNRICDIVGSEHPGCLTASAVGLGLGDGECGIAREALPLLEDQLSNFGLNREFAVIRADGLGELREPFNELEDAFYSYCF